jgi:hypothetical protein
MGLSKNVKMSKSQNFKKSKRQNVIFEKKIYLAFFDKGPPLWSKK